MQALILFLSLQLAALIPADNCTCRGIRLYGRVQLVDSFEDVRVKLVSGQADLNVKLVDSFADSCGLWQIVTNHPDFRIKLVDSFEDVSVRLTGSFPGEK